MKGDYNMEFNNVVKFENEEGKVFEMLILKEFDYKEKKYAVLLDSDCNCDETCECGCQDNGECTCGDDCDCGCNEEKALYILDALVLSFFYLLFLHP